MRNHRFPPSLRGVFLCVAVAMFVPAVMFAQPNARDVSAAFIQAGAVIEDLTAVQISGIVVIRGKTNDENKARDVSRIANELGFQRVANLIAVRDDVAEDAAIVYTGQRRLELEPALAGCRFRVDSTLGIIRLTGSVQRDVQSDLAVHILSKIAGVKEVRSDLGRL